MNIIHDYNIIDSAYKSDSLHHRCQCVAEQCLGEGHRIESQNHPPSPHISCFDFTQHVYSALTYLPSRHLV